MNARHRPTVPSRLACIAALGLATAIIPASAQDLDAVPGAATGQVSDEIERFCTNIADAARDRRYALQAQELAALQVEIDGRIAALETKRAEYEEWLRRREEFLARAESSVVEIYRRMRPDAAAERLAELNTEIAAGILMKLDARQAGTILNEMERRTAAALTTVMVAAARKEDPS